MSKSVSIVTIAVILAVPGAARAANVKGTANIDLSIGFGGAKELMIREPEMCEGEASARVEWNRNKDRVRVKLELEGIPYEPSYCYEFDPSTPYNAYPECVLDGFWQMWLTMRFFTRTSVWYYDSVSGDLLGNEHDLVGGPPPGAVGFELPAIHMMCMGMWQPNPFTLEANVTLDFAYDEMRDGMGTPGAIAGILPFNMFDEDSWYVYYTHEILPSDEVQSWDDTLEDIQNGGGFSIATSLEPQIKPPDLFTHDNLMIGWGGAYPPGFIDPLPPEVFDDPDCGTEQIDVPFPDGQLPS